MKTPSMRPWILTPWLFAACGDATPTAAPQRPPTVTEAPPAVTAVPTAATPTVTSPTAATPPAPPPITLSIADKAKAGPSARCTLAGPPLAGGGKLSLASDREGRLYVGDGQAVRRYQATIDDTGCTLALDASYATAGVLTIPEVAPAKQALGEGPTYMRSGGFDWQLAQDGDKILAYDYLGGVAQVDRGQFKRTCPDLLGVRQWATVGGKRWISRDGLQPITGCKPGATTQKGLVTPWQLKDTLWIAQGKTLATLPEGVRIDGADAFKPGGFCSVSAVSACGQDRVCVLDNNCKKLEVFAGDGGFVAEIKDPAPGAYGYDFAAAAPDGGLWLAVKHKDGQTPEGAIYHLPASEL